MCEPLFKLKQKVLVSSFGETRAGIIAGVTLPNGINYLVIYGDRIDHSSLTPREWVPELWLLKRDAKRRIPGSVDFEQETLRSNRGNTQEKPKLR